MIFVQNCKFPQCFFDSISLEIMYDDHLVKKRSPRIYKYGFHVVTILNFCWSSSQIASLSLASRAVSHSAS